MKTYEYIMDTYRGNYLQLDTAWLNRGCLLP
jgi:hypothetical protein